MKTIGMLILLLIIAFSSCEKDLTPETGIYLGQSPPVNEPIRFMPNRSYRASTTWWWRSSPTFSPDGNEMYFTKYFNSREVHEIWFTKSINGVWTEPQKAPFSNSTFDAIVTFLMSNDTLYFYSPLPESFAFRVTRNSSGWSAPVALSIPLPSNSGRVASFYITQNKTIYFSMLSSQDYNWATADIYKTLYVDGQYTSPVSIGSPINISNVGEFVGYVDPDERFMIYESQKSGGFGMQDMYISYRNSDGTWRSAINLGSKLNSSSEDGCPSITPDGKYFFFTTQKSGDIGYTPYWVDAGILESLK